MDDQNDQFQQRLKKSDELKTSGIAPYGRRFEAFVRGHVGGK